MVALSIVVCSKSAKIVFARQFVPMSRRELEEYVVQFSRKIESFKDITHFETDKVRYLFISIDSYFLLLITSKNSNIIEDTEILKLIHRLIQDVCVVVKYDTIIDNVCKIMLGVDDIVCLGYRSGANIAQIKTYMEMESLEEKEFRKKIMEKQNKVQRELNEKGREFDKMRREKKIIGDAVSSSSFNFVDEMPKITSSYNKNKSSYSDETVESTITKNEDNAPSTRYDNNSNKNEKKQTKSMKLSKRRGFQ
jgi:hypothetical protein